jgi:ADP-heptose:LPS heptosyltransferase
MDNNQAASGPRILVMRCGAVGDTVLATCVIDPLLARWPDARIEWLATPLAAPLFAADPRILTVHTLKYRKAPVLFSLVKRRLLQSSRKEPFELVLNLETAGYFRRLARALHTRRLVGYGDGASWQRDRHGVENHRAVLAAAGIEAADALPHLRGSPAPADLPERFFVLHPGNSHVGSGRPNLRAWPDECWVALRDALQRADVPLVVTGTRTEREIAARVAGSVALDLAGQTDIPTFIGVVERAAAVICTDSGPVHVAAAVGTPIIGLYGPTLPRQTAPFGEPGKVVMLRHPIDCSPCYGTARRERCRDNRCMRLITVDEVLAAVLPFWTDGQEG